jgi:class 3 adenylate cyclase
MSLDFDALSFTAMIRLRDELSNAMHRRFGRDLALLFTDVVGSTNYFARFGDAAGRSLQQRHFDHLHAALTPRGGRLVDTAGDGAFAVFPSVDDAARAAIALQEEILAGNQARDRVHRLSIRAGLHWSSVLTDGVVVSGDGVNLCARVAGAAEPGGIQITRAAFTALASDLRPRCRDAKGLTLKGIPFPVEVLRMDWLDETRFPTHVDVLEAGRRVALPDQEVIAFGRLHMNDGAVANDVVLTLPDDLALQRISRWHFELHRHADGFRVRPVSSQGVEVDGVLVVKGGEAPLRTDSVLRLGGVMTLRFRRDAQASAVSPLADATVQLNDDLAALRGARGGPTK